MTQSESSSSSEPSKVPSQPIQFRLSTLMIMNLVAGIVIAYMRPQGTDLFAAAALGVILGGLFGLTIGRWQGQVVQRTFWGITAPAMMLILVAKVDLSDRREVYVWPIVAAVVVVQAIGDRSRYVRMLLASLLPEILMIAAMAGIGANREVVLLNGLMAAIGGALSVILVDLVRGMEHFRSDLYPWVGLGMVLLTIAAAETLPRWIPGW
jgi:hypothetical protein